MASWLKKIKKKIATFLAIVAMVTLLVAVPVLCLVGVAVPTIVAIGAISVGVGALAFVIDKDGAAAAFTKVGEGVATFAGSAAEALTKTVAKVGEGVTSGFLSSPFGLALILVGGYLFYDSFIAEKERKNVIRIESDSSIDKGDGYKPQSDLPDGGYGDSVSEQAHRGFELGST